MFKLCSTDLIFATIALSSVMVSLHHLTLLITVANLALMRTTHYLYALFVVWFMDLLPILQEGSLLPPNKNLGKLAAAPIHGPDCARGAYTSFRCSRTDYSQFKPG